MSNIAKLNSNIWRVFESSKKLHEDVRQGKSIDTNDEVNTIESNDELNDEPVILVSDEEIPQLSQLIRDSTNTEQLELELKAMLMKVYWNGFYKGFENGYAGDQE
ncbi:uncharacterized protein RJT21DRAFT_25878 [Scheffersomyces amazonensis]|uniref:uncharacterized protein n=1 Tax=Scheffersomyces amazonensis TaxID=1078765 RepID=UPI00315DE770